MVSVSCGRNASIKSKLITFLNRILKRNGFVFYGRDASLKSKSTSFLNRLLKRNYFVFWPRFFIKININFVCKMVFKTKWFRFLWPRCFIQKHFVFKTISFLKPFHFKNHSIFKTISFLNPFCF